MYYRTLGRTLPTAGLLLLVVGCSMSGGLPFMPQGDGLSPAARCARMANLGPQAIPRELDKRPMPAYTVEPGDVLLIQSLDLDSSIRLPADQPVLPDGTINLGRYGCLQVAGRTVAEIEQLVQAAVAAQVAQPGYIMVRLITRQSKVFYVLGEVNAPGAYPLHGRETVLDGILMAGGLTDRASEENVILSRPTPPDNCRVVLPVCYTAIVQLADTTTNYQLAPGDRIFIPTKSCLEHLLHGKGKTCVPGGHGHPAGKLLHPVIEGTP